MKDTDGTVIYIGKAINLRNRVRSYYHISAHQDHKTRQLVSHIQDIEWILVGSELEALILEMNLIKRYRPHYNVLLKDDKHYPYIKVHWADAFPKVTVTRNMVKDGSRYYGPYTSVWAVHQSLDVLRRIFPYLTCDRIITGKDERACLYHDIKLCSAPCIGVINQAEYRQMIDDLGKFLEGRTGPILERLRNDMQRASEQLRFERAAALRDQILAIEKVVERQKVVSPEYIDSDVLAMARSEKEACMQVFFIRGGKLIGREYFLLEGTQDTPDAEVMAEFIKQFYDQASSIPPQVLLPNEVEEANIIQQWLSGRRAKENQDMRPVEILIPREGQQQELVQMATENAIETLAALKAQWETDRHRQTAALAELEFALKLTSPPNRIECYDISNTQGTYAVGSMVVFEQGVPDKKQYRRFNIRSVEGPDDFASMEEVLMRRFKRWEVANHIQSSEATPGIEQTEQQPSDTKQKPSVKVDPSFSHLPDLLIVDGGKGQLSRAMAVIERFNLTDKVPAIGLAKKEEEVYVPGHSNPIFLSRNSQGLYLLQRMRDEAHRFAITAHRKRRTKQGLTSTLESIPGVGPNRRKALLTHFGSLEDIHQASIEQLAAVPSITHKLAQVIKAYLG
ncbi:MAG: excinuclease ABC subunit UvrC [Anaerolineales bacterium]|nr:excinuclease ABC subunit UvrC [Anaerolineales bacterium]